MNWEIISVCIGLFAAYLSLRGQIGEIKAGIDAAHKRIDDTTASTNARLDDTWKVLLTITREIASIKQDKK